VPTIYLRSTQPLRQKECRLYLLEGRSDIALQLHQKNKDQALCRGGGTVWRGFTPSLREKSVKGEKNSVEPWPVKTSGESSLLSVMGKTRGKQVTGYHVKSQRNNTRKRSGRRPSHKLPAAAVPTHLSVEKKFPRSTPSGKKKKKQLKKGGSLVAGMWRKSGVFLSQERDFQGGALGYPKNRCVSKT